MYRKLAKKRNKIRTVKAQIVLFSYREYFIFYGLELSINYVYNVVVYDYRQLIYLQKQNYFLEKEDFMAKYVCNPCKFEYDEEKGMPEKGIAPGTKFDELPEDWCCPKCGATKWMFSKVEE